MLVAGLVTLVALYGRHAICLWCGVMQLMIEGFAGSAPAAARSPIAIKPPALNAIVVNARPENALDF